MGQSRRITANTATTFTVDRNWDTTPNTTSVYKIAYRWSDVVAAVPTYASHDTNNTTRTF